MSKKKRKYNPNWIKTRSSYSVKVIAYIYRLHPRTVQDWIKQGLKIIEGSKKPYLILGNYVREFLKEKNKRNKCKLNPDEFYCTRCRTNKRSLSDKITIEIKKQLGKSSNQVFIRGICEVCKNRVIRFSSDSKLLRIKEFMSFEKERNNLLNVNTNCSINTDI